MAVPEIARDLVAVLGGLLVLAAAISVVGTLIVPRPVGSWLTRFVDKAVNGLFRIATAPVKSYRRRDQILAAEAAVLLLAQLGAWLLVFYLGYALLFWPFVPDITAALITAGPGLWGIGGIGSAEVTGAGPRVIQDLSALSGIITITLQISYLPTLYGAFNRRETEVSLLAGRGGSLSWGPEILLRYQWAGLRAELGALYQDWERLMADIAESHSSYTILVHFRSPDPRRSWVTSMIAVMDAAAIELARTPSEASASARLVITGGSSALNAISRALGLPVVEDPLPTDPIGVSFEEFSDAWRSLDGIGFPAEVDAETGYRHFRGWRVNWEPQAYRIARLVQAPPLDWTGPRDGNLPRLPRVRARNRRPDDIEGVQPNLPLRRPDSPRRKPDIAPIDD